MICDPCTRGDHCGQPGEISTQCFCQHLPRRSAGPAPLVFTTDDVKIMTDAVQELAARVSGDVRAAVSGPARGTVDVPLPDDSPGPADGDAGGLEAVLRDVPTVTLLSAWEKFHRRHAFAAAAIVRRLITERLEKGNKRS